jgi:PAS domain S-box-containing protein
MTRGSIATAAGYLWKTALLGLVYYGAARLGLRYASIGHSISLIWPPTGIAFAGLVLLGYRYWPGVAAGALLANLATPVPDLAALGISVGNTLEAVVATYLFCRVGSGRSRLEELPEVRALVLVAAPIAAIVSAGVGVFSLTTLGSLPPDTIPTALATWWVGDLLGALVLAPLLLSWLAPDRRRNARGIFEIVVLCLGTAVAAEVGLGNFLPIRLLGDLEYPVLLFPFVIWAALRFGVRGATLMTFVVCVVAVWHAVQGGGPFIAGTPAGTLFAITSYLGVVAVTGLILASVVSRERERASRALDQSQNQLRRSLDAARMGTWFWSVASNTLTWDDNLRQLYGLGPGDTVKGYDDFIQRVHPDDREFVADSVRRGMELGGELNYEFRILLPDGRLRWIADLGEIVRDPEGRPVSMTGVCMDVTDRRLAEDRMRQAHRMESVGRLAGGVAHETNNQMSVVLGASRFVLMRSDLPGEVRGDVELIERAAARTASVTAQLLAFSRRQLLKPQVVDLNRLIRNWSPVLFRIMGEDCQVNLKLDPAAGPVMADPGQLQQALLNLAINARDAMPRGGTLAMETFVSRLTPEYARLKPDVSIKPGRYAVLAVSDSGHGMDRETLGHIFEPFFTTKGVGQGTGLGLSTVYGIVKQSEGYVWAYSEPGSGTTFKLYFPITTASVPAETVEQEPFLRGNGERILLVEDEPGVRQIIRRALEEAGYRVLEAENGEQALELAARQDKIDLLLTDVVMPGMSGKELASRLTGFAPDLPVIYTSGYTDGEIARRGLLDPGATFIQKPFSPDSIVRAVAEQLT